MGPLPVSTVPRLRRPRRPFRGRPPRDGYRVHLRVDSGLWLALEEYQERMGLSSASGAAESALLRAARMGLSPDLESHPKVRGMLSELGVRTAWHLVPEVSRYAQRFANLAKESTVVRGLVRAVVQGGSQEKDSDLVKTRVPNADCPGNAQDAPGNDEAVRG